MAVGATLLGGAAGHRPGAKEFIVRSHRTRLVGHAGAAEAAARGVAPVPAPEAQAPAAAATAPAAAADAASADAATEAAATARDRRRAARRTSLVAVVAVGRSGGLLHQGGRHHLGFRGRGRGGVEGGGGGGGGVKLGSFAASGAWESTEKKEASALAPGAPQRLHLAPLLEGPDEVSEGKGWSVEVLKNGAPLPAHSGAPNRTAAHSNSSSPHSSATTTSTANTTTTVHTTPPGAPTRAVAHSNSSFHHLSTPTTSTAATTTTVTTGDDDDDVEYLAAQQSCPPGAPLAVALFAKHLGKFYGAIYLALAAGYLLVFVVAPHFVWLWAPLSQASKYVSRTYATYPRLLPVGYTFLAFGAADCLAQTTRVYWHGHHRPWDLRVTLAVASTSSLCYGLLITYCYQRLDQAVDSVIGDDRATEWTDLLKRVVISLVLFVLLYLPIVAILFDGAAAFLSRSVLDATTNCAASTLVALPGRVASTLKYDFEGDHDKAIACAMFWPPIQIVNHIWVRRWSPEFRTTLDAFAVLLWDAFVVTARLDHCTAPLAVGPTLSGHGPATDQEEPREAVDCSRWALLAMAGRLVAEADFVAHEIWYGTVFILNTTLIDTEMLINATEAEASHIVYEVRWYTLTGFWFIVFLVRLTLYAICAAAWTAAGLPFRLVETITNMFWVPFPHLFPYDLQPYWFLWPWYENDTVSTPWTIDKSYDRVWPEWYEE